MIQGFLRHFSWGKIYPKYFPRWVHSNKNDSFAVANSQKLLPSQCRKKCLKDQASPPLGGIKQEFISEQPENLCIHDERNKTSQVAHALLSLGNQIPRPSPPLGVEAPPPPPRAPFRPLPIQLVPTRPLNLNPMPSYHFYNDPEPENLSRQQAAPPTIKLPQHPVLPTRYHF